MGRNRMVVHGVAMVAAVSGLAACVAPKPLPPAAPDVVVVVGGLSGVAVAYEPLAARLEADGYTASIFELPGLGTGDIDASAVALDTYIDDLMAAEGVTHVDLVAHSEGGLVSRAYLVNHGGTAAVDHLVTLGTPHYGTLAANIATFLGLGDCIGIVACEQMSTGSDFLAALNEPDDTAGEVDHTTIATIGDELVQPFGNAHLVDGADTLTIQAACPLRSVGHIGLITDGTVYEAVAQALDDAPLDPSCFAL